MKSILPIAVLLMCGLLVETVPAADLPAPAIIPQPQKLELQSGSFPLTAKTCIYVDATSRATGEILAARLRQGTGYPLPLKTRHFSSKPVAGAIYLTTKKANSALGTEGYELTVTPDAVVLRAPTDAGLFYGMQTLYQLLPPAIFARTPAADVAWQLPCVNIQDWPRFPWRGLMLDVARHFFTKQEVETLLDAMALHKMNRFHWHLTDDQGWRIEIKKYPKLTQVGAWRAGVGFDFPSNATTAYGPDGRYGGFYTQDDIREVVAYAAARHITVIPEIEMPGHSTAALTAYPEYSCTGGPFSPQLKGGVFDGVYSPANEKTFQFLEDVLTEVFALFPSKYVHIGGDEVEKDTWKKSPECQALMQREGLKNEEELQSWFIRRIEKFVSAHGHSIIGWSEILQGGLPQNATVMDWIGGAKEAATAGHDVIMAPTKFCYLDFYQSTNLDSEPRAINYAGPLLLNKVYSFNPMPADVPAALAAHILGTQGNLWTEYVASFQHAEYMLFPRACAIAEITWSPQDARNWDDFIRRLRVQAQRFDELGINYRHASITNPDPDPFQK
ncbi:MAG TPA: beta-N-acetylhexosaminidase [Dongiaceae bacterium]|jgi:hexosaminidase|nr:beta-N-acetylhexosaminidase [Dongiaceae bacterium]